MRHRRVACGRARRPGELADRFREDANTGEDLRLGGYADAWLVEPAHDAADAAGGAGGRLRVLVDLLGA